MATSRRVVAAAAAAALIAFAALAQAPDAPADGAGSSVVDTAKLERYVYRAQAEHADSGSDEIHTVVIAATPSGFAYRFEIRFDRGLVDRGVISTTRDGGFVSAVRRRYTREGVVYEGDSLSIVDAKLVMEKWRTGEKTKVSRADVPRDRPAAVDASLILWMRGFPFGDPQAHDVFMADWSQRTVDVDVRDRGVETITVPAGIFECHRMEVTVRVMVFRPKITFWITVDAPHVLVQHRGKRGPFTPVFETRLLKMESP